KMPETRPVQMNGCRGRRHCLSVPCEKDPCENKTKHSEGADQGGWRMPATAANRLRRRVAERCEAGRDRLRNERRKSCRISCFADSGGVWPTGRNCRFFLCGQVF